MNIEKVSHQDRDDSASLHKHSESQLSEHKFSLLKVSPRHGSRRVSGREVPTSTLPMDQYELFGLPMLPPTPRPSVGSQVVGDVESEGRPTLSFHPENLSNYFEASVSDVPVVPVQLTPSFVPLNPIIQQRLRPFVSLIEPSGRGHGVESNEAPSRSKRTRRIRKFVYKTKREIQTDRKVASKSSNQTLDVWRETPEAHRRRSVPLQDPPTRPTGPSPVHSSADSPVTPLLNPLKPFNPSLAPKRLSLTSFFSDCEPCQTPLTLARWPPESPKTQPQSDSALRPCRLPPLSLDRTDFEWIWEKWSSP